MAGSARARGPACAGRARPTRHATATAPIPPPPLLVTREAGRSEPPGAGPAPVVAGRCVPPGSRSAGELPGLGPQPVVAGRCVSSGSRSAADGPAGRLLGRFRAAKRSPRIPVRADLPVRAAARARRAAADDHVRLLRAEAALAALRPRLPVRQAAGAVRLPASRVAPLLAAGDPAGRHWLGAPDRVAGGQP